MDEIYDDVNFTIFLHAQKKAIEVAKWIEGEKIHSDPGDEYVMYWVKTFAEDFKSNWDKSKCKHCKHSDCRYKVKTNCNNFLANSENDNT